MATHIIVGCRQDNSEIAEMPFVSGNDRRKSENRDVFTRRQAKKELRQIALKLGYKGRVIFYTKPTPSETQDDPYRGLATRNP